MNLHAVAGPIIAAVNPPVSATISPSAGFSKDSSYKQVPAYGAPQAVTAQMQPLTYADLRQIEGINTGGGKKRALYLNGDWEAVTRPQQKGGDLVTLADGTLWLTVQVLEDFSATAGWVKVAVVEQVAP